MSLPSRLSSYSTIFAVGHAGMQPLLGAEIFAEEKIDGSQFSFGVVDGEFLMRSKNADVYIGQEGMFQQAVEEAHALEVDIPNNTIVRCEFLSKPKHNVLKYDRTPKGNLIVFDVEQLGKGFMSYDEKRVFANKTLKLEVVPKLYEGILTLEHLQHLLGRVSCLGGCEIEGVVIKPTNYNIWGTDKKVLMAKYVSEKFKETHRREWKGDSSGTDFVQFLIHELNTEARWEKAIQHLREAGQLENQPRDIGKLMVEVKKDVRAEESEYVKEKLFKALWPKIERAIGAGLPEYYKMKLAEEMLTNDQTSSAAEGN